MNNGESTRSGSFQYYAPQRKQLWCELYDVFLIRLCVVQKGAIDNQITSSDGRLCRPLNRENKNVK